jgi:hypothetical protein
MAAALVAFCVAGARAGSGSSSGWIDDVQATNLGTFVPVQVNGHATLALLWGGPTTIDTHLASSLGLHAGTDGSVSGLNVVLGSLMVHDVNAKVDELYADVYGTYVGRPVAFRIGEEFFKRFAVDIDAARQRIAFSDPKSITEPAGAIDVPLREIDGERVVPLSLDGSAPAMFELELGNVNGPLLVTPKFAREHQLLAGRRTSQRLSGQFTETVVTLDRLSFAGVDFSKVPIAVIPDSQVPPAAISGGVGMPLLSKFRLIIDYSRDRLFAIQEPTATQTPLDKDRMGVMLVASGSKFVAVFVAPGSPAEAAGFRKGDEVALIDGRSPDAWPGREVIRLYLAGVGTKHTFTMADGSVRRVTAEDFF